MSALLADELWHIVGTDGAPSRDAYTLHRLRRWARDGRFGLAFGAAVVRHDEHDVWVPLTEVRHDACRQGATPRLRKALAVAGAVAAHRPSSGNSSAMTSCRLLQSNRAATHRAMLRVGLSGVKLQSVFCAGAAVG